MSPSPSRDNTPPPSPKKEEPKPENNNTPRRKFGVLEPNRGKRIRKDYASEKPLALCEREIAVDT
jgi:hypothetical protein